jgi:hypothetical protein
MEAQPARKPRIPMNRRTALSCAAAALLAAPRRAAASDVASLDAESDPVSLRALAGTRVRASGFALPHVRRAGGFFVLSANAAAVCPHCRAGAGSPASDVYVYPRDGIAAGQGVWEGTLDVGGVVDPDTRTFSFVRLYDARRITD